MVGNLAATTVVMTLLLLILWFVQRIPMSLSEDTSVQDIIVHTLRQLKVGLDKVDRFGLYVVPKECHKKKFVPDESTSRCNKHSRLKY